MTLAPIVIFVYNRPDHTEKTLRALARNKLANESHLIIFADGPKESATLDDVHKIKRVHDIITYESGFKSKKIITSETNKGLAESVIHGITQVVNQFGKVIVLEDDIVTSPNFLEFMNTALHHCQDNPNVFGITGYNYPSSPVSDSVFLLPIASSWGYGTWVKEWNSVCFDAEVLLGQLKPENSMDFGGYPFHQMLVDRMEKKNDSWDICYYASMFLQNKYFLFPNKTLVENIGFDGSGTHCGEKNIYHSDLGLFAGLNQDLFNTEIKPDENIIDLVRDSFLKVNSAKSKINSSYFHSAIKKAILLINRFLQNDL